MKARTVVISGENGALWSRIQATAGRERESSAKITNGEKKTSETLVFQKENKNIVTKNRCNGVTLSYMLRIV